MKNVAKNGIRFIIRLMDSLQALTEKCFCRLKFKAYGVKFKDFQTVGVPFLLMMEGSRFEIGSHFMMINKRKGNPIGRVQACCFSMAENAFIKIGDSVGVTSLAIVAQCGVTIGNGVKIGGGTCIYDTDFHSLDPDIRKNPLLDRKSCKKAEVTIKDNAFIGAHATILKGVTIGENAVIGACSVVTKSVPDNEVWAGNPAHFIGKLSKSNE